MIGQAFAHQERVCPAQMTAMQLMVANGSLITLHADDTRQRHLWRAAMTSVGRLGIITSVTLRVVPQRAVQRQRTEMTFEVH